MTEHARAAIALAVAARLGVAGIEVVATVADVALMRRAVGKSMGVKASGGIRTLADLRAMVAAGATRVGASASVQIMEETVTAKNAEQA